MIDYRKILVEYIDYVAASEGTDFLSFNDPWLDLTAEEKAALIACRDEARARK